MRTAQKLTIYWDTHAPAQPGWYVEARDESGDIVVDSMKIWFPVEVDWYGERDKADLVADLREAYPDATIIATGAA